MSASYDLYQAGDSWLHRLDPRCKLLFTTCGFVLLLSFRNLWIMGGALLLLHVALYSARISCQRMLWVWRTTLPTVIMIAAFWVILYPGTGAALLSFWFVRVTAQNLGEGLAVALRISALAFTMSLWLFSTDQSSLVKSMTSIGLPYEWGLTLAIALRYLPTLANTFRTISEAQQARALDMTKGGLIQRARAYVPITVAMLISALRTAESLARALESRALGAAGRHRTSMYELHMRTTDRVWLAIAIAATALLLSARYMLGFGANPLALL